MPTKILTSSTVFFIAACLPISQAAAKQDRITMSDEARETINDLRQQAASAAEQADELRQLTLHPSNDPDSNIPRLDAIKDEINAMGKEMQALENERESLAGWERQAVDKTEPLLREMASTTTKALEYYNENRTHLWTDDYRHLADKILDDADQVSHTLRDYLAYAKASEKERKLSHTLGFSGAGE